MPVSVQVPCRIRVDARALAERPDELEAAFATALARALERSRREVLVPRGRYLPPLSHEPELRWSGAGNAEVPRATRRAFEERLRRVVDEAVTAAGLDSARGPEAPPPLPEHPWEVMDPARRLLLGGYLVPSYDQAGSTTVVDFEAEVVEVPVRFEWVLRTPAEIRDNLDELALEALRQHGPLPPGVPNGIISRVRRANGQEEWLVLLDTTPPSWFTFSQFGEYVLDESGTFVPERREPTPERGTAERRLVTDRGGLAAAVDELMGPDIRARIEAKQRLDPGTTRRGEYDEWLDKQVAREVDKRVDAVLKDLDGKSFTSLIVVRMGANFVLLVATQANDALHWTGSANILPVTISRPLGGGGPGGEGGEGRRGSGGQGRRGTGSGAGGEGDEAEAGIGGTGGGTGTGVGTGAGAGRPPGGFVFDPSVPAQPAEGEVSRFPVVSRLFWPAGQACTSFNGEPELSELAGDGEPLRRTIDDIAFRLQMGTPCYYAATFCLMAARALEVRAADISRYISTTEREAFTQPVPEGTGNLGPITFRAVASPAVQFLRHLAGVVPRLHDLAKLVMRVYSDPEHWPKVKANSGWIDNPAAWRLHFLEEFSPAMDTAVGEVFTSGCQAILLQLLLTSRQGIKARLDNFTRYAPIFERLIVSQLTGYVELLGLRERLRLHHTVRWTQANTEQAGGATAAATTPAADWFGAARALSGAFVAAEQPHTTAGEAGQIVEQKGVARIRDAHGVMWSEAEIDQALIMQRGAAEGIDPLVKQIADLPDVISRFRDDRHAIGYELYRVLNEMSENNTEMLGKARESATWAFRASPIAENIPAATVPGSRYALQGIHKQVHEQLGEFFGGDVYYARGIDALFSAELGRKALLGFGLNIGIIALAILCPPAGFLAGVAVAAVEVVHAHERERLYGALIDPELVLTRAQVEVELFAAYLGLALSLLPEVGTAAGAVARGTKAAVQGGLGAGARAAGRHVMRRVSRQVVQAAQRDLLQAFVTEILVNEVMEKVISKVLEPVLAHIEREAMLTGSVGGPEGARFALMVLGSGRAAGGAPGGGTGVVR